MGIGAEMEWLGEGAVVGMEVRKQGYGQLRQVTKQCSHEVQEM
jgi:hypothetical protein